MASFFRRTKPAKSTEEADKVNTMEKQDTDNFDMFSGMDVAAGILPSKEAPCNLTDIQDLEINIPKDTLGKHKSETETNTNAEEEDDVFKFLTQETDNFDDTETETADIATETKLAQEKMETLVCLTDITSKTDPIITPPTNTIPIQVKTKPAKKKKKRIAVRPGHENTALSKVATSDTRTGSKGQDEDALSVQSDTSSIYSVDDHDDTNQASTHSDRIMVNDSPDTDERKEEGLQPSGKAVNATHEADDSQNKVVLISEHVGINQIENQDAEMVKIDKDQVMESSEICVQTDRLKQYDEADKSIDELDEIGNTNMATKADDGNDTIISPAENIPQVRNDSPVLTGVNTSYIMELDEDQRLILIIDSLRFQQQAIRDEFDQLNVKQKMLLEKWTTEHLTEEQIHARIRDLREQQTVLVTNESYAEAADIDQEIDVLLQQFENFKYIHPFLDNQFVELLKEFQDVHTRQVQKKIEVNTQYEDILKVHESRILEKSKMQEKQLDEDVLILKEERLKLERGLSHTCLDKDHLLKNECILNEEIERKTKCLNEEKDALLQERSLIQIEIAELKLKLGLLEKSEQQYTENIVEIGKKIQDIVNEFQPRIETIQKEKEITLAKESQLQLEMEALTGKEERISNLKSRLQEDEEKNKQLLEELQNFDKASNGSKMEIFSFNEIIDLRLLEKNCDDQYERLKLILSEQEVDLQKVNNKVLEDAGSQSSLQRSLNDLETQVSVLQELKQTAVKDRKFKDAQRFSDEIKTLTADGEAKQTMVFQLQKEIQQSKLKADSLQKMVNGTKEQFKKIEIEYDMKIIKNLKTALKSVEEVMLSHPHIWIKEILMVQKENFQNIIQSLEKKHGLCRSDEAVTSESIQKKEIESQVEKLEAELKIAIENEDWETSEKLNNKITEKHELLSTC